MGPAIGRYLAALATLLAAGSVLGACECPKIRQEVYVATPDPALASLVEACRSGVQPAGTTCGTTSVGNGEPSISCACLPMCRRVLMLIDQFSGDETLLTCQLITRTSTGTGGAGGFGGAGGGGGAGGSRDLRPISDRPGTIEVVVTYRPSTCE